MSAFCLSHRPLALAATLMLSAAGAAQVTLDVPGTYATIGDAIKVASPGDTIQVQPGVYPEFNLNFLGKDLRLVSVLGADATIIDAQHLGRAFVFNSGETAAALVEGFTIQNGIAPDGAPSWWDLPGYPGEGGGGMLIDSSSPSIARCIFRWNAAGAGGLGGRGTQGPDGSFGHPDGATGLPGGAGGVGGSGGAIFVVAGSPTIDACRFLSNVAGEGGTGGQGGQGGDGGGSWPTYGDGGDGGPGGTAGRGGDGGAIATDSSTVLIRCSLFHDNHAGQAGSQGTGGPGGQGGPGSSNGNPGPIGSASTDGWGGSLGLFGFFDEVNGCTVLDSGASLGGGIYLSAGVLYNSILWGSSPSQLATAAGVRSCDIQGGYPGLGNINLDPAFVNPAAGDWHLSSSSPCINAGDSFLGTLATTDLDGLARVAGGQTDIGAFEYQVPYMGTLEDFVLQTVVGGVGDPGAWQKAATAGDQLTVGFDSPGLTFTWEKPLLAMQTYTTGSVLPPTPGLPSVWVNGSFPGLTLLDLGGGPLGAFLLPPGGVTLGLIVPPGLVGTTVRVQAFVISTWAANGIYAATDAHEIEIL